MTDAASKVRWRDASALRQQLTAAQARIAELEAALGNVLDVAKDVEAEGYASASKEECWFAVAACADFARRGLEAKP